METNELQIKTSASFNLPFFPGFYNTFLESTDASLDAIDQEVDNYENEGFPVTHDDFDIDYKTYEDCVSRHFVEVFKGYIPNGLVDALTFVEVKRPKAYNCSNDEVVVEAQLKSGWYEVMTKWLKEHEETMRKRISHDWFSRDGFISLMSSNYDEWFELLLSDDRYFGVVLQYMIEDAAGKPAGEVSYDMCMETLEDGDCQFYMYVMLKPEKRAEYDEFVESERED